MWQVIHFDLTKLLRMSLVIDQSDDRARKKNRSNCMGGANFALGQMTVEVWWSGGQVKLASEVVLVIISNKSKAITK